MAIAAACCIILLIVSRGLLRVNFEKGNYDLSAVVLSSSPAHRQQKGDRQVFAPHDTISCTVTTVGVDGIVGMRWFAGSRLIREAIGKTQDNTITTFIMGRPEAPLPEGMYRVEVFLVDDPLETVYFEVHANP